MSNENEVTKIMDILGRPVLDGNFRGNNLYRILSYLRQTNSEDLHQTYQRLTLVTGLHKRTLRENYIEGILSFGIIKPIGTNTLKWVWVGEKAFNGFSLPEIKAPIIQNMCKLCGKAIPKGLDYCSEECINTAKTTDNSRILLQRRELKSQKKKPKDNKMIDLIKNHK